VSYCHHEQWDGTGYPQGLRAEDIPRPARILALVDVADTLASERPYRPRRSHEEIRAFIAARAGSLSLRTGGAAPGGMGFIPSITITAPPMRCWRSVGVRRKFALAANRASR
jgi:hypothetical protein